MENDKYLNEERYQKAEKTIVFIAFIVLAIGLSIGGFLIYRGIAKPGNGKVENLKVQLENKKNELESKGVKYDSFAKYSAGEAYDLKVITNALDSSFEYCKFSEYKDNPLTKEYCSAKNSVGDFASTGFIMFGVFICIASCMVSFSIFIFAKRRQILAFSAQQVIPIAKEGINEMAPTIGSAAGEIAKGIKKGLSDEEK